MKKQLSKIALGLSFLSLTAFGQQNYQPCNTYDAMEQYWSQYPSEKVRYDSELKAYQENIKQNSARPAAAFQYTIPVVFHVLHTGGPENVSDASIQQILVAINDDYAATTPDYNTIAMPFKSSYINSDIKFVLATKDPSGNGTTGITHQYDSRTEWQQNQASFYNGITWTPNLSAGTKFYLNIIVVKNIISSSPISGGVVGGYTYKPGTFPCGSGMDAIVVRSSAISNNQGRTLSHEIGHWLNLAHTFGNTNNPGVNCGDDDIDSFGSPFDDTPPTKGHYNACPTSASGNVCAPAATTYYGAGQANVENIMDYSTCPKNFTTGQTNVMRNSLANIPCRANLWSAVNLTSTGANGTPPVAFAPKAEFLSANDSYTVCAGGSLSMKDFSYNGVITTYNWAADNGGTAAAPSSSNTTITFPNVGVSNVTLTVSNAGGSSTKVRPVHVMDGSPAVSGPYIESFEVEGIPTGWSITEPNPGSASWAHTWDARYDGDGSVYIEGANTGANQTDALYTPIYDIASVQNPKMEFALAYAQENSTQDDKLRVQASIDCGGTWIDLSNLSAGQMQAGSGGVTSNSFVPSSTAEWKTIVLSNSSNWNSVKNSSSAIFRFTFIAGANGFGNNIYIDAINLTGEPTGISEITNVSGYNVYPNPSNGETTIRFNLSEASNVKVAVLNVLGQEVKTVTSGELAGGEQTITFNKDQSLSAGIYFINTEINGAKLSSKLIIK